MKEFPTLYHRGSKGAIYSWTVWTEGAYVLTEYGQVNGKKQTSKKKASAKNVGKRNETTPEEQAVSEAESMWTYKLERKYKRSQEEAEKEAIVLPMLAKDFKKRANKVSYPVLVQPKLDGLRCLAICSDNNYVRLLSRAGKEFNVPHLRENLEASMKPGEVLDGELYIPGESFQTITSLVKRLQDDTERLEYHVYDYIEVDQDDQPTTKRREGLVKVATRSNLLSNSPVVEVPTTIAHSEKEVYELHGQFVSDGYEGAIVRNPDGKYKMAYRSNDLLKLKHFDDDEYEIVGYVNGKGKFSDCVIWICETEDGDTFQVTPKGTFEQRKQMYQDADDYIGSMLKVRYQDKTDDGIPRFPIGLGIRIPEDMS